MLRNLDRRDVSEGVGSVVDGVGWGEGPLTSSAHLVRTRL